MSAEHLKLETYLKRKYKENVTNKGWLPKSTIKILVYQTKLSLRLVQ